MFAHARKFKQSLSVFLPSRLVGCIFAVQALFFPIHETWHERVHHRQLSDVQVTAPSQACSICIVRHLPIVHTDIGFSSDPILPFEDVLSDQGTVALLPFSFAAHQPRGPPFFLPS